MPHCRKLVAPVLGALVALSACSSADEDAIDAVPFESADPSRGALRGAGGTTASAGGSSSGAQPPTEGGDAARAIEEADILKIAGDRLYALSQYGGLNVIDVSDPDRLDLLGRQRVQAAPFELYVREEVALVLYNGYGAYVEGDDGVNWVTTGSVIAFDTSDPAAIRQIASFEVPGTISDSRIVGNVLYVVGFENGSCWDCSSQERTAIVSLDVTDPTSIEKVDELAFEDDLGRTYSWQRSISVTEQRIYVAGPEWGADAPVGSTIDIVDIGDPGGALMQGASIEVEGQIASRWQMDEYEGVLRVISQKAAWRPELSPRVETFEVTSSNSVRPLGETSLVIPTGEDLRSVRFDGPRAYAITALQTDPLFTIDLSDPANPRQTGALEIPGWVFHMEPRSDRVLGLGYEQGNPEGGLAVSLFDVSDPSAPALLDRVNFGGDWPWLSEDQDRIHKAFNVLDAEGLILMPFSGWSDDGNDPSGCSGRYQSGVQLIDWTNDELVLRAAAPAYGQARRGFVHGGRLFALSDERVESFDIADRDAPERTASLALAHYVTNTVAVGEHVVRVAQNWWTNVTELDVTRIEDAAKPQALGRLEIPEVSEDRCRGGSWLRDVSLAGNRAYVVYDRYDYLDTFERSGRTTRLLAVDVSDPAAPTTIGDVVLEAGDGWGHYWGIAGAVSSGSGTAAVGSAVAVLGSEARYDEEGKLVETRSLVHVADMRDPSDPRVTTLALPLGAGTTGLHVSGNLLALGRSTPSPRDPSRVRFFVDRIDVTDPSAPELLPSVSVPGSLLAFDDETERAFTADYRLVIEEGVTLERCYAERANASFEPDDGVWIDGAVGRCTSLRYSVRLVDLGGAVARELGATELAADESLGNSASGDDRLFVTLGGSVYYGVGGGVAVGGATSVDCVGCGWAPVTPVDVPLMVFSGIRSGDFAFGRLELEGGDYWGYAPLAASGEHAVLSLGWRGKLSVVDATDVTAPSLLREEALFGNAWHLTTAGDVGIASLGYDGVQTISLRR